MEDNLELIHPNLGTVCLLLAAVFSFFLAPSYLNAIQEKLLLNVDWWIFEIAIKMLVFFLYLIPLAIGAVLIKIKVGFIQLIGMIIAGLGAGIVVKIALTFAGILNPYRY